MVELGKYNRLKIVKELDFGLYLDGGDKGEILLPIRYVPQTYEIGEEIEVFIYFDSEDRIIATTETPLAQVGEVAWLNVKSVNRVGAFLDWGLMKDLLVPFREQKVTMKEGYNYLVYLYVDDESQRIVASAKIDKFLDNTLPAYEPNQEVDIIIGNETELGYKVVINNQHSGIIYHNEIFSFIQKGDKMKGYIKLVRPDEKIDVTLQPMGYDKIDDLSKQILDALKENDNYIPLSDKSPADDIINYFSCSKKNFKKAIGTLYKQRLITILPSGIRLN